MDVEQKVKKREKKTKLAEMISKRLVVQKGDILGNVLIKPYGRPVLSMEMN